MSPSCGTASSLIGVLVRHDRLHVRRRSAELASAVLVLALSAATPAYATASTGLLPVSSTPSPSPTFTARMEDEGHTHDGTHANPSVRSSAATDLPEMDDHAGHGQSGHGESPRPSSADRGRAEGDHTSSHDTGGAATQPAERPRTIVLGSFAGVNGLVLLAAAVARRRRGPSRRDRARESRRIAGQTG